MATTRHGDNIASTHGPARFSNREISWLDFGQRLLELAATPSMPLLERVKFLAILSEGLDELFEVRVAGLEDQLAAGVTTTSPDGLRPSEQLALVRGRVAELVHQQSQLFLHEIVPALAAAGVSLSDWSSLDEQDREHLVEVFHREIFPVLTPLAVDPGHPFPYISNLSLNLVVAVMDPATGRHRMARVKVPPLLPRFVVLPDHERFVPIEQVIAAHLGTLFPGRLVGEPVTFRVTRNAALALEAEGADDLLAAVELELQRRRFGRAVRLEIDWRASDEVRQLLVSELDVPEAGVFPVEAPIDLGGLWAVFALDRPDLHEAAWTPTTPPPLATSNDKPVDLFAVLRHGDVLVHHPYDSFATSVEAFVSQAAADPDVLAIKQTLYRTSGDSAIVESLVRAAAAGKQVAVLMELQARFDEKTNITWARVLEEAGVHVVYGIVGLKTHSKTTLVLRRERDGIRRYCHVGTGNYNARTARQYEDLGLLTAAPDIGADVGDLFNFLTGFSRHASYRQVVVSPLAFRDWVLDRIVEQTAAGTAGRIVLKVNGLTDPEVIDALYAASHAGVPVELAVRGLCCLRPGVPGLSETISVRSVVGRFLEHSRIFRFGGGDHEGCRPLSLHIGSGDLMERNLDRRIEVIVPVREAELQRRLLGVLDLTFADDTNAWRLGPDGRWLRVAGRQGVKAQELLQRQAVERSRRPRVSERRPLTSGRR